MKARNDSGAPVTMKRKGVFFDLGRVLLDFDMMPFFSEIAESTGRHISDVRKALVDERWLRRYECGEFDDDAFFDGIRRITSYSGEENRLRHLWTDIFRPIEKNISLVKRLTARYPVGLISNTSPLHISHIRKSYDVLDLIPVCILSYEVGVVKPDRRIFARALQQLQVDATGSVFIDDLEENLSGARDLGMDVIHYSEQVDLEAELARLGFAVS